MSGQERNYHCQRCLNHGDTVLRKGHLCKYKRCSCADCVLNEERKLINRKITKNRKMANLLPKGKCIWNLGIS